MQYYSKASTQGTTSLFTKHGEMDKVHLWAINFMEITQAAIGFINIFYPGMPCANFRNTHIIVSE